jgi:adenine-specific DNA-methyltransferase
MNKTDLIHKIKQLEGISQDERSYLINLVNTKKKYGLVWEDKPEDVEEQLRTQLPVLREVVERRILAKDLPQETKFVEAKEATLFSDTEAQDSDSPLPIKGEAPNHILIEGDNLHAITALTFTHEGKIDVIYIDPPYNTGNKDFRYNDRFVDKEDSYRHSKWLSFMYKRLQIAKRLLKENGIIFISIDENESHNLRVILDEIFGETNFIEQLVWNKRIPKNDKGIGNIHEYVLFYAKNYNSEHVFLQKKEGIEDVNEFVQYLKKRKIPIPEAEKEIKRYYKKNDYDRGITLYNSLNEEYRLWGKINVSWPNAKTYGPRYDVIHPATMKPCKVPDRGWRWIPETFNSLVDYENIIKLHDGTYVCGRIWFAKDENTQPSSIKFLDEVNDFLLRSIISTKSDGGNELIDIIGVNKFDYPKPSDLIHRLINSVCTKEVKILDFFAGSGTTLHATMKLNAEDGGNRQCILVTNNENNICEEVTYERNRRVIQGYTNSKGEWVSGLTNNNLRYYKSEFVGRELSLKNKRELTRLATELLCIKEDCYEEQEISIKHVRLFANGKVMLLVLFDDHIIPDAIEFIKKQINGITIKVYVFSMGSDPYTEDFYEVSDKIELCALPDAIYKAYHHVLPKNKRFIIDDDDKIEDEPSNQMSINL